MKKTNLLLLVLVTLLIYSCKEKISKNQNGQQIETPQKEEKQEQKEKYGDLIYREVLDIRDLLKSTAIVPPFIMSVIGDSKQFDNISIEPERKSYIIKMTSKKVGCNALSAASKKGE